MTLRDLTPDEERERDQKAEGVVERFEAGEVPDTADTFRTAPEGSPNGQGVPGRAGLPKGDDGQPDAADDPAEAHHGHLRIAERVAREHAQRLRFVHKIGWHVWDGHRWAVDGDGAAKRCATETLKTALWQAVELPTYERDELIKDVRRCETAAGLNGVLDIAESLRPLAVAPDTLDRDPYLLNTKDGTYDLRTHQLRPADPADLITKVTGCGLDPQADAGPWERFLAEVLPDEQVRVFVRRLAGYALLGVVREHVLPVFHGTGANGKDTLLGLLRRAFGDYAIEADPELLVDRRGFGAHPTGQADLRGVRLATTSETDEGRRLATATAKRLTGGNQITARRMAKDFFSFSPSHTLVLVTNHLPKVPGGDPALWRRLLLVPFDVVIPPERQDVSLPDRLGLSLPAVLRWSVAGYRDYCDRGGLVPPESVRLRTDVGKPEHG
jgi:putative DNA primase/helicase